MKPLSRAVVILAIGFLALDAILLMYAGVELSRWGLIAGGAACALGVPVVVVLWRRHRRKVAELAEARREMRAEVESIRELLQSRHLHN
ncbi:MAG TPA: hypothetical protein VFU41_13255 [Gemmatimonadales bacterium]|nr:hypothetical protein [Gemmatimonadales bacterium]